MMWFIHLEIVIILGKRHLNRYLNELNMKCLTNLTGRGWLKRGENEKEVANRFGSQSIELISREALPNTTLQAAKDAAIDIRSNGEYWKINIEDDKPV